MFCDVVAVAIVVVVVVVVVALIIEIKDEGIKRRTVH